MSVEVTPLASPIIRVEQTSSASISLFAGGPVQTVASVDTIEGLETANKADGSVIYYDGSSDMFKADSLYTVLTLTDGGNF